MKDLMKIFGFIIGMIILCAVLGSCTDNAKARAYGGTETIDLPKGQKLMEVTWKDDASIWYLTEPMEDNYVPKTKTFKEHSPFGVIEGKVIFNESR